MTVTSFPECTHHVHLTGPLFLTRPCPWLLTATRNVCPRYISELLRLHFAVSLKVDRSTTSPISETEQEEQQHYPGSGCFSSFAGCLFLTRMTELRNWKELGKVLRESQLISSTICSLGKQARIDECVWDICFCVYVVSVGVGVGVVFNPFLRIWRFDCQEVLYRLGCCDAFLWSVPKSWEIFDIQLCFSE